MLEVMLFGEETEKRCSRILKERMPGCLAAGRNSAKLPCRIRERISRRDEFILLRRSEPEEYWCVFDAKQDAVIRMAERNHLRTLTCGFSPYDTLVLSSVSLDQAVVSLQREIHTVSNRLLEPGDYLIHRPALASDSAVLLCTATLLLADWAREDHIFHF
ncbi:MAG: hypothetical protein J6A26_03510 [Oscillospiraceae bacterium]|nr:hypothetical protein [Oscillospiraceae bacterium]